MSKLIMWNLLTLDGYFEGDKSWALDFHQIAWGDELKRLTIDQLHAAGTLIFGRVTYEGMAAYWQTAKGEDADLMNSLPKVVVSRTLDRAGWNNTKLVKENAVQEISKLKQQSSKDIFVFGSANLSATLMQHNLFDEYRLCLVPVVLGKGKPLFAQGLSQRKLNLQDERRLKSGSILLYYVPEM